MGKLIVIAALVALAYFWWRGRNAGSSMSLQEARLLLDVQPGATPDEIRAAHRRIIARVHPDAGGSAALAGKINVARDLLLKSSVQPRND